MSTAAVPLGALVEITGGGTPSRDRPEYWNGCIPWASVKDLAGSVLSATKETITPAGLANSASRLIPPGHVVIATRMGLGKASINTVPIAINQDLKALRCGADLDPRYLLYFLLWTAPQLEAMGKGATVKGIKVEQLARLMIPLPPPIEQRRIVAILDKADVIRRKRQQAIQLTDDFLRSAFLDMFGDPVTNPRMWATGTFSAALTGVEAGWSAKGDDRTRAHNEWAVLKISAITSGRFDPTQHKVVDEPGPKKRPLIPRRGDLLFSRANTRELVGAVALVERDEERLFLPDKLWRLVPNRQVALPEYLRFVLGHRGYRTSLAAHATGTSGSMLNVSQAKLLRMRLPVPPVAHQEPFAAFVWKTYDAQEIINRSAIELNSFFESLVQRAFRGELTSAGGGQGAEGDSGPDHG